MHHDLEVLSDVLDGIQVTLPIGPEPLEPDKLRAALLQFGEAFTVINRLMIHIDKRLTAFKNLTGRYQA